MGIDQTIDITGEQRKTILALLERHLPNTAAWVYGSRAKWTSRPQSDLDMVVFATPEQARRVSDLREAFEESNLPYRVDLFVWDDVPEQFRKRIEAEHVVLVEREELDMAAGWLEVPAENFCGSVRDGTHDSPKPVEDGRYLITSRHIIGDRVDLSNAYRISEIDFNEVNRRSEVHQWDVLITMIGTVGDVCLIREKPNFAIKNIGLFKSKGEIEGKWLYYYLKSPKMKALIETLKRGTTQAYIPLGELRRLPIRYSQNRSVAENIVFVLSSLDDKIELNRRMNETLEAMARALFKSWFVDFLPVRAKMAAKQNNPSLLLPQAESGTWFVYAIECADGSLDIGQTENLRQRWLQHSSSKGGRWTKSHPPQRVAYWEKQPSRQAAVEREKWLKTGFGRKWLKKEIATRTQTGDPVRAKMEGRDTGLPQHLADLFPDRLVDSELGEIPEGWEVRSLGEMVETVKGRSYRSQELVESDTALVTLKSFSRGGGYRSDGLKSFAGTYKPDQVVHPGEIAIACTDVTQAADVIGRPAIVQATAEYRTLVGSLDTLIVRPTRKGMTRAFFYFLASNEKFVAHTYAHTTGTTVLHLAKDAVPSFRFACPSTKLVQSFDDVSKQLLGRSQTAQQESESLLPLRDTLLPRLVSGELRVEEAENHLQGDD